VKQPSKPSILDVGAAVATTAKTPLIPPQDKIAKDIEEKEKKAEQEDTIQQQEEEQQQQEETIPSSAFPKQRISKKQPPAQRAKDIMDDSDLQGENQQEVKSTIEHGDVKKVTLRSVDVQPETASDAEQPPILDEIIVVDTQGKGPLEATDEYGNPTTAKTAFIRDPEQMQLYSPVKDEQTGEYRTVVVRGQTKQLYRRTRGAVSVPIKEGSVTRMSGDSQMVIEMTVTDGDGNTIREYGFSQAGREYSSGDADGMLADAIYSLRKRINIRLGRSAYDDRVTPYIQKEIDDGNYTWERRRLVY